MQSRPSTFISPISRYPGLCRQVLVAPHCGSSQGCRALKGFPLSCRRERSKVPYIVRQCVEEIERRGMEEVGIYRVSGVATDIQALKAAFDVSECQPWAL